MPAPPSPFPGFMKADSGRAVTATEIDARGRAVRVTRRWSRIGGASGGIDARTLEQLLARGLRHAGSAR